MNHAITVSDLLLVAGVILGIVGTLGGLLYGFACSMSDVPEDNESGGVGCIIAIGAQLLFLFCVFRLLF